MLESTQAGKTLSIDIKDKFADGKDTSIEKGKDWKEMGVEKFQDVKENHMDKADIEHKTGYSDETESAHGKMFMVHRRNQPKIKPFQLINWPKH